MNFLLVFPDSFVKSGANSFSPMPFAEALEKRHNTDAHAVGYLFPSYRPCPRLRLGHIAKLIEQNHEPVLGWVFVDVDNDDHKDSGRWTAEEAKKHWANLKGPPELDCAGFYSTRGGYRLLWRLDDPIPVSLAADFLRQFYAYLREENIPVDPEVVEQWNTLYRLPRVKRDGQDLQAYVDLSGLEDTLRWSPSLPLKRCIAPRGLEAIEHDRPEVRKLSDFELCRFENLGGILKGKTVSIKEGKPYAKGGSRQSTMFRLSAAIVAGLELDSPELVFQILAPSTLALEGNGAPTLADLWDRCCYLVNIDRAKRKARADVAEKVKKGQPPGIYHGASYYVRDTKNNTYRPPVTAAAICQALEQWTQIPGLETRTEKGSRPFSTAEYLAQYFRQAVEVVFEMSREKGVFLPQVQGGTLLMGCCQAVDVQAVEHPDIGYWLEQLGGPHLEKLLDWLATVRKLDRPTCAIYLQGPPGTGKGLFSSGVASLWGTGATSYADAVGKFNGALMRNPIVHVDEFFQVFDGGDGFSGAFRSLIGESVRQLRRKNLPSATIKGCPRLVIGANNADALKLTENLTQNDLNAIAKRILHVEHNNDAAAFLSFIGGRDTTSSWVFRKDGTAGLFAEHVAFLEATRTVQTGDRFLVEGELSDWHRDLVGSSGLIGATLAALAHFLHRKQNNSGIQIDGASVWVNVPTLRSSWGALTGNQPPNEGPLAKALKTLSGGVQARRMTDVGRLRFYRVSAADIFRRAEMLQIGDADDFAQQFNPEDPSHVDRPEA